MFGKSYRLPFTLLGIPVLLDISFLVVLPIMAWLIGRDAPQFARMFHLDDPGNTLRHGALPYLLGLVAAVGLFVGVVIHELGHAVTARLYDVKTKSITLWILGGVAALEEIPRRPWSEAVIAIAGPITSVLVAAVCWLPRLAISPEHVGAEFVLDYLALTNLFLAIFNLIPALPMDGGRILRSLLALAMPWPEATRAAGAVSKVLAILIGIWGFLTGSFFLMLIAFFVYIAGSSEASQSAVEEILRGLRVRQLMTAEVKTVEPDMSVAQLTQIMFREHHLGFPVVDREGRVLGLVTLQDIQGAKPEQQVAEVMKTSVETIPLEADAPSAFRRLSAADFRRLLVLDPVGRLAGILTKTDLMHALKIRSFAPSRDAAWSRVAMGG